MKTQLAIDPAAELFPLMQGQDLAVFKADIEEHGVRDPIVIHDGKILDGRNRYNVSQELGIDCPQIPWTVNGSKVAFVISRNLHRRHLDSTQKATAGAKAEPLFAAEAKARQKASGGDRKSANAKGKSVTAKLRQPKKRAPNASDQAAKAVGVSARYVQAAKQLQKEAPDLFSQMEAGKLTLRKALKQLQDRKVATGKAEKSAKQVAYENPARRWHEQMKKLYTFIASTRQLGGITKLTKKWTPKDRQEYASELRDIVKELNHWLKALGGAK